MCDCTGNGNRFSPALFIMGRTLLFCPSVVQLHHIMLKSCQTELCFMTRMGAMHTHAHTHTYIYLDM